MSGLLGHDMQTGTITLPDLPSRPTSAERPDSVQTRLDSALSQLRECHGIVSMIEDRIAGPHPPGAAEGKGSSINAVAPTAMTIRVEAEMLRKRLLEIVSALGE